MKPRRVTLLLEVSTDIPLPVLKNLHDVAVEVRGHLKRITVLQTQVNVIRAPVSKKRIVRIHQ